MMTTHPLVIFLTTAKVRTPRDTCAHGKISSTNFQQPPFSLCVTLCVSKTRLGNPPQGVRNLVYPTLIPKVHGICPQKTRAQFLFGGTTAWLEFFLYEVGMCPKPIPGIKSLYAPCKSFLKQLPLARNEALSRIYCSTWYSRSTRIRNTSNPVKTRGSLSGGRKENVTINNITCSATSASLNITY